MTAITCVICEKDKPLNWSQSVEYVRRLFPAAIAPGDHGMVCRDCLNALIDQRDYLKRGARTRPEAPGGSEGLS